MNLYNDYLQRPTHFAACTYFVGALVAAADRWMLVVGELVAVAQVQVLGLLSASVLLSAVP